MPRRSIHALRLGLRNVSLHKLRSTLTTLGVVLGVASVIVMLAVGEAARYKAVRQIQDLGASNIILRSVKPARELQAHRSQALVSYGLTAQDLERVVSTIPTIVSATPVREQRKEVRHLDRKLDTRIVAVTPAFLELNDLRLSRGRFITEVDNERCANVVALGAEAAEILFPYDDPVGRSVRVGDNHYYQVVGVTEPRAPSASIDRNLPAQEYNRDVYIPFATDQVRFGKVITSRHGGTWQSEKLEISQITVAVDSVERVKTTAEIIESLIRQFHTQNDIAVIVPLELLQKAEQTKRIFTMVLGAIASISLVVGGIGIMNIMLATVTERTREIGIRRALGAKRSDITSQFLVETVLLSSTGGVLGIGVGVTLSYLVMHLFDLDTIIRPGSVLLAFVISAAVGLVFGTYPARRAARLEPIEALRHE